MTAAAAIHPEIIEIDRHQLATPPLLAHGDQAGVGKIHRLVGVLAYELTYSGVMLAEIPRAHQEAVRDHRQHWLRITKKVCRFSQDRFARIEGCGQMTEQVLRPRTKPWFVARQGRNQRPRVEKVDHALCLRRSNDRRIFALVGGGTVTLAEPRCRSHGERLAASARCRTASRTYSATLSFASAAAFCQRTFSSAATRMVSVSLMSTLSHTPLVAVKARTRPDRVALEFVLH